MSVKSKYLLLGIVVGIGVHYAYVNARPMGQASG